MAYQRFWSEHTFSVQTAKPYEFLRLHLVSLAKVQSASVTDEGTWKQRSLHVLPVRREPSTLTQQIIHDNDHDDVSAKVLRRSVQNWIILEFPICQSLKCIFTTDQFRFQEIHVLFILLIHNVRHSLYKTAFLSSVKQKRILHIKSADNKFYAFGSILNLLHSSSTKPPCLPFSPPVLHSSVGRRSSLPQSFSSIVNEQPLNASAEMSMWPVSGDGKS